MRPSIIFSSVGQPLPTEGKYVDNHWRRTDREKRLYETFIVNYNYESGFKPEPYSYDDMLEEKGFKWPLSLKFLKAGGQELMDRYEYIGIWDDDVQTSIEALNHSLVLAHNVGAKIWQMSLSKESETRWATIRNNPELTYSLTNFAEIMCPVYHTSLIPMIINFWELYELQMGWGFDTVACELAESPAMIIHSQEMYHPSRAESTYDKAAAFKEMHTCINEAYPAYWKKYHDMDVVFNDRQVVYSEAKRVTE
jgi:hypothetical protein